MSPALGFHRFTNSVVPSPATKETPFGLFFFFCNALAKKDRETRNEKRKTDVQDAFPLLKANLCEDFSFAVAIFL